MSTVLFAFVLILGLPVLIVAGFFLIWAVKILTRGGSDRLEEAQAETRLIQELHQSLLQMEERIETLETILLDAEKKENRK